MRAIIQFPSVELGHRERGLSCCPGSATCLWVQLQHSGTPQGHIQLLLPSIWWALAAYSGSWYRKQVRASNRNYLVNTSLLGWWGRCWKASVESLAQDLLSQLSLEGGSAAPCHDWLQEIFAPDIMDPAGPWSSWQKVLWWASWAEMEE